MGPPGCKKNQRARIWGVGKGRGWGVVSGGTGGAAGTRKALGVDIRYQGGMEMGWHCMQAEHNMVFCVMHSPPGVPSPPHLA